MKKWRISMGKWCFPEKIKEMGHGKINPVRNPSDGLVVKGAVHGGNGYYRENV